MGQAVPVTISVLRVNAMYLSVRTNTAFQGAAASDAHVNNTIANDQRVMPMRVAPILPLVVPVRQRFRKLARPSQQRCVGRAEVQSSVGDLLHVTSPYRNVRTSAKIGRTSFCYRPESSLIRHRRTMG